MSFWCQRAIAQFASAHDAPPLALAPVSPAARVGVESSRLGLCFGARGNPAIILRLRCEKGGIGIPTVMDEWIFDEVKYHSPACKQLLHVRELTLPEERDEIPTELLWWLSLQDGNGIPSTITYRNLAGELKLTREMVPFRNLLSLTLYSCQDGFSFDAAANLPVMRTCTALLFFCDEDGYGSICHPEALQHMPNLELACFYRVNDGLQSISWLKGCKNLLTLAINFCEVLSDISDIGALPSLRSLTIESCRRIKDWSPLETADRLAFLWLGNCENLWTLTLRDYLNLRYLQVMCCNVLTHLSLLDAVHLEVLSIVGCKSLRTVGGLAYKADLKQVTLIAFGSVDELDFTDDTALSMLDVSNSKDLPVRFTGLKTLANLQALTMNVSGADSCFCTIADKKDTADAAAIKIFDDMPWRDRLRELHLAHWGQTLPYDFCGLADLVVLSIDHFPNLTALRVPRALRKLTVCDCAALTLLDLSDAGDITSIEIENCSRLRDIKGLSNCASLLLLRISYCPAIVKLSVTGCVKLVTFRVAGCSSLTSVHGLSGLAHLSQFKLTWCENVSDVDLPPTTILPASHRSIVKCPELSSP